MRLDVHVPRFNWAGSPDQIAGGLADLATRAEALGVRTMSLMDHLFQMEAMWPADEPMLEAYTSLAFIAARTSRLRLRTLVTGVTYRNPGLLAKIVSTLDVLSEGRTELGIGAAWYEREHRGLGFDFPSVSERFERLEEAIQICLQMWGPDNGPFEGRHYQLAETLCVPQPVSAPRPRILIGGAGERKTLRLVAKYADACNLFGGPEQVKAKLDVLRRHCDEVGRDIAEIEVTVLYWNLPADAGPDTVLRAAEQFAAVGVSTIVAGVQGPDPAGWLEATYGPVIEQLGTLQSAGL